MGSLAQASGRQYIGAPTNPQSPEDWFRTVANVINLEILQGKLNNTGTLTLTAGAASTTLTDARIGANSAVLIMPKTANAATALATTYFDTFAEGSCKVNHANNAQVDRTFVYAIFG